MGMTIKEKFKALENEYTHLAGKYQMMQADYNARLKADMAAMLTELQLEIEEKAIRKQGVDSGFEYDYEYIQSEEVVEIIQQKINALKGD